METSDIPAEETGGAGAPDMETAADPGTGADVGSMAPDGTTEPDGIPAPETQGPMAETMDPGVAQLLSSFVLRNTPLAETIDSLAGLQEGMFPDSAEIEYYASLIDVLLEDIVDIPVVTG